MSFKVFAHQINPNELPIPSTTDHSFECPLCEKYVEPKNVHSVYHRNLRSFDKVASIFQCPACKQLYFVDFIRNSAGNISVLNQYPYPKKQFTFSPELTKLSPQFVKIYNQALQSEAYKLDELSGIGYRKALEFLIKDYLISQATDKNEQEKIRKENLSQAVNRLDESLKALALTSTWLGNDPAHYVQKYEDKSLEDLKRFLKSVIAGISYKLVHQEAQAFIAQNKK